MTAKKRATGRNAAAAAVELYAKCGYPLVACDGKKPRGNDWGNNPISPKEAEQTLRDGGNVGMVLGPRSGVIDIENDAGEAGESELQALFGTVPATPTYHSRRGKHRLFRYDPRLEGIGKSVVKVGSLEFRTGCNGTQVQSLLPPSETDGFTRRWVKGLSPTDVQPATLPAKVLLAAVGKGSAKTAKADGDDRIPPGIRNELFTGIAGVGRKHGLSERGILDLLTIINQQATATPLPAREIATIARSIGSKPSGQHDDCPKLWPKPVDGGELLGETEAFIRRYVVVAADRVLVIALWVMAAWCVDAFDRFPHLAITSPAKRCGKTRMLQVLGLLCPRPLHAASVSPAVVYHAAETSRPTLLIDEAQQLTRRGESSDALRELLCAGIDRNAKVLRMGGANRDELRAFQVFGPKAVALIGELDDVLADRCLPVRLERKPPGDMLAPYRSRPAEQEAEPLAQKLARWAKDNRESLMGRYDRLEALPLQNDRLAELLLPLMAVQQQAAPAKAETLTLVAVELDAADVETESPGIRLLAALCDIFGRASFLSTAAVIKSLCKRREEPWGRWNHGYPISPEALSRLLRGFGVHPRHSHDRKERGYYLADLQPAFARYCPDPRGTRPTRPTRPADSHAPQTPGIPAENDHPQPDPADGSGRVGRVGRAVRGCTRPGRAAGAPA